MPPKNSLQAAAANGAATHHAANAVAESTAGQLVFKS